MTASIEGVTLMVEDVQRSVEFYLRIPGISLIYERPGQFALLKAGQFRLQMLPSRGLPPGAPRFHLEATAADLDSLFETLQACGIEADGPPADRAWGDRSFHATDPDGNEIEFSRPWSAPPNPPSPQGPIH